MSTPRRLASRFVISVALAACGAAPSAKKEPLGYLPRPATSAEPLWLPFTVRAGKSVVADPRERHLTELRQLTFEGDHGRARFSPDGRVLLFESRRGADRCTQLYAMSLESGGLARVSSGQGRAALGAYIPPSGERVVLALSPDRSDAASCSVGFEAPQGVWSGDPLKLFIARADGSEPRALLPGPGQEAQAFVSADGSRLGFTSTRDGNAELYTASLDGTDLTRITYSAEEDVDGALSADGASVVWSTGSSLASLLAPRASAAEHAAAERVWVPPTRELMVAGTRGQDLRFLTQNGKWNAAPWFLPSSRRVIFSSDVSSPLGSPNFELYVVDSSARAASAGGPPELERVTHFGGFDGLPTFSPDGSLLVFVSSRHGRTPGARHLFLARWVE